MRHLILAMVLSTVLCVGVQAASVSAAGPGNVATAGQANGRGMGTEGIAAGQPSPTPMSDIERENLELRIEGRLKEHVSTQFAILITISLALFAILITTIVIFFALRTKEAAVAEAAKGIEEFRGSAEGIVKTIRTEFEMAKNEIEGIMTSAAANARLITDMRLESELWASNVAQRVAAEQSLSVSDQLTLDLRSDAAQRKNADVFSMEDYFLLIAKHIERGNWELARELASSMRLVASNPEMQSAGYYYEGSALLRLGRTDEAIGVLTEAANLFQTSASVEVRHQVAKAMNNRLVALMNGGRHEEALRLVPENLAHLGSLPEEKAGDLRRKLMINKGNALSRLGRNPEAIACYDDVIAEIMLSDPSRCADRHAHALYNKGCAFAQMGKVSEAVACLEESRSIAVTSATANIATDSDFDPIRSKPTFKRFLSKHGIVVAVKIAETEVDAPPAPSPLPDV